MSGGEAAGKMVGAELLGPAETSPEYRLSEVAPGFLVLVEGGPDSVPGELWEVEEAKLAELRSWEYSLYDLSEVSMADGRTVLAFVGPPEAAAFRAASRLCGLA